MIDDVIPSAACAAKPGPYDHLLVTLAAGKGVHRLCFPPRNSRLPIQDG